MFSFLRVLSGDCESMFSVSLVNGSKDKSNSNKSVPMLSFVMETDKVTNWSIFSRCPGEEDRLTYATSPVACVLPC